MEASTSERRKVIKRDGRWAPQWLGKSVLKMEF